MNEVEALLADAIGWWMEAPSGGEERYAHGKAQGIARALATFKATTFGEEWEAGLDRYQNRIVVGNQPKEQQ